MANQKITELAELTNPISSDTLPIVDVTNNITKKVPIATIRDTFVASASVLGTTKLSTAPVSATEPIAVGTNDSRIPTADQGAALAGTGTPSGSNKFVTADTLASTMIGYPATITNPVVRTYLAAASPATWTKPAGLKYIVVEVQAAGGNGANGGTNNSGGAGSGGGYSKKLIAVATLGATETVTIGAVGSNSSFGSHATANTGANASSGTGGGAGGTAASGDINVSGGVGINGNSSSGPSYGQVIGGNSGSGMTYGTGGYGGTSGSGSGQAGNPAIVIVTEHYI